MLLAVMVKLVVVMLLSSELVGVGLCIWVHGALPQVRTLQVSQLYVVHLQSTAGRYARDIFNRVRIGFAVSVTANTEATLREV